MSIPVRNVLSHWTKSFSLCSMSTDTFYKDVENSIRARNMPTSILKRVNLREGSILSPSREYVRVMFDDLVIDVCAAPFGKDFFISWWQYETEGILREIFGKTWFRRFLRDVRSKRTFYQVDSEAMFSTCVHECVIEAIDNMVKSKGLRVLSEQERMPPQSSIL